MISVHLINSEATLNDFFPLSSVEYTPGDVFTVAFQIFNSQKDLRYVQSANAEVTVTFTNTDGDETELDGPAVVVHAGDRSLWKIPVTAAESAVIGASNLKITLDVEGDAVSVFSAILKNALSKNLLSGDC